MTSTITAMAAPISTNADGTLSLSWTRGHWAQVAPLTFENLEERDERLAFQTDVTGRVVRVLAAGDGDGERQGKGEGEGEAEER